MRAAGMGASARLMQAPKLPLKLECCSERPPLPVWAVVAQLLGQLASSSHHRPVTRALVSHFAWEL